MGGNLTPQRAAPAKATTSILARQQILFLLLATTTIYIDVGARIYFSECLAAICVPAAVAWRRSLEPRLRRSIDLFIGLGGLWLLLTVASSLIHGSRSNELLREVGNVTVLILDIFVLSCLIVSIGWNASRRAACLGLALAALLGVATGLGASTPEQLWKFVVAYPLTSALMLAIDPARRWAVFLVGMALAAVNLAQDYRSFTLLIAVSVAIALAVHGRPTGGGRRRLQLLVGVLGAALLTYFTYSSLASSGALGEGEQWKYEHQSAGTLGLVGGGRKEIYFSLPAFLESPLIGYGAAPPFTGDVLTSGISGLQRDGVELTPAEVSVIASATEIPSHSYLFGALLTGGLAGGALWVAALAVVARAFRTMMRTRVAPVGQVFLIVLLTWNVFFSPLGADARMSAALALAAALAVGVTVRERASA